MGFFSITGAIGSSMKEGYFGLIMLPIIRANTTIFQPASAAMVWLSCFLGSHAITTSGNSRTTSNESQATRISFTNIGFILKPSEDSQSQLKIFSTHPHIIVFIMVQTLNTLTKTMLEFLLRGTKFWNF